MPTFVTEQVRHPILNGRGHALRGPPIGLFHSVFNSFHAALRSSGPSPADPETYSLVKDLFIAFARLYDTEDERIAVIDEYLFPLLGERFLTVIAPGVRSDGVIVQSCGGHTAYVAIREIKNEIGTPSADPYTQGSLSYRKYWAGEDGAVIRARCYCPAIILAIAGPWLCVSGGVYLLRAVVQPLTDYVWLGGDPFDEGRLRFAARLFVALRSAINDLRAYYKQLESQLSSPPSLTLYPDALPFAQQYGPQTFTYRSRMACNYPYKLLYLAELDGPQPRLVVVKFVSKYCAQAHRLLAAHNLSPVLHYAGTEDTQASMYGARYMVVMDFVDAEPLNTLTELQFQQVTNAIRLLHSHHFVFGDLRLPNILIKDGNAMIVDFDWCGEEGKACYPESLNHQDIDWAVGVSPGSVITREHDLHMLDNLKPAMLVD
ncbi:uncharacterized protein EI90DRAFT_2906735 [Cantharellus anzutake]|uniref:uncharacterized protein n=1 Tax=Cantharellus anzutake TaxID=1750568 RepID=UPI0019085FB2|nr:uncharacterized protein EI90DRAFT_2906735 [Cantharellus anzutake]KAF8340673.1 hypothetical protein EI90DRAFT_2906735 [Cantharellus anzutake]